jgi:hypothetical protein
MENEDINWARETLADLLAKLLALLADGVLL